MYDPKTEEYYCHKRVKTQGRRIEMRMTSFNMFFCPELNSARKESKTLRRNDKLNMCRDTPIKVISLVGQVVKYNGKFYGLCGSCANPIEIKPEKYFVDCFSCKRCTMDPVPFKLNKCFLCEKVSDSKKALPTIKVWDDVTEYEKPEYREISFCLKHKGKPWLVADAPLSTIQQRFAREMRPVDIELERKKKRPNAPGYLFD